MVVYFVNIMYLSIMNSLLFESLHPVSFSLTFPQTKTIMTQMIGATYTTLSEKLSPVRSGVRSRFQAAVVTLVFQGRTK